MIYPVTVYPKKQYITVCIYIYIYCVYIYIYILYIYIYCVYIYNGNVKWLCYRYFSFMFDYQRATSGVDLKGHKRACFWHEVQFTLSPMAYLSLLPQ